ncbi:hypothetical protein [Gilliamella apicola]|uniref:hypothetical protein n=1 Tax=Gilliamella sp. Bif1-4 TaxID=3120233 RepID=UPI00159EE78A
MIDALGNHYHYRYNQQGLLTTQIDCSGYRSTLFYDEWGVPELSQNAVGDSVNYTFSNAGRLRAIIYPLSVRCIRSNNPPYKSRDSHCATIP